MPKKFKDVSIRLINWDYSRGSYFITICTKNRVSFFGEIVNDEMFFSESGNIAEQLWKEIPTKFPYAKIDSFIVMPNHVHGIITITKHWQPSIDFDANKLKSTLEMEIEEKVSGGATGNKNPMLNDNIGRIIRWFKGRCSFEIHKISEGFEWQSRFHDRVIRSQYAHSMIKKYIENNVSNWGNKK